MLWGPFVASASHNVLATLICSDITFTPTTPEESRRKSMLIVQILCHSSCDRRFTCPSHSVDLGDALIRSAVSPFHHRVQEIHASVKGGSWLRADVRRS